MTFNSKFTGQQVDDILTNTYRGQFYTTTGTDGNGNVLLPGIDIDATGTPGLWRLFGIIFAHNPGTLNMSLLCGAPGGVSKYIYIDGVSQFGADTQERVVLNRPYLCYYDGSVYNLVGNTTHKASWYSEGVLKADIAGTFRPGSVQLAGSAPLLNGSGYLPAAYIQEMAGAVSQYGGVAGSLVKTGSDGQLQWSILPYVNKYALTVTDGTGGSYTLPNRQTVGLYYNVYQITHGSYDQTMNVYAPTAGSSWLELPKVIMIRLQEIGSANSHLKLYDSYNVLIDDIYAGKKRRHYTFSLDGANKYICSGMSPLETFTDTERTN